MNSNDSWNRSMPGYAPVTLEQAEDAQSDTEEMLTVVPVGDEQIEEDDSFSLDKFQVVRREFFSHISEPSITFNNYKIGLNSASVSYTHLDVYKRQVRMYAVLEVFMGKLAAVSVPDPHSVRIIGFGQSFKHHVLTVSYTHLKRAGTRTDGRRG